MSRRSRRARTMHKADTRPPAPQTEAVFTPEQAVAIAQALASKTPVNGGQVTALPRNPGLLQIPFSPGVPLVPSAINSPRPDSGRPEPRAYEYPITANLPGSNEKLVPWSILRQAADGISIFRKCIEIRKAEFSSLDWDIVVSKKAVMRELRAAGTGTPRAELEQQMQARLAPEIARLSMWWEEPDRRNGHSWIEWIKKALEERFVLDALAIYPRHTFGGDLYSFEILDGSTIKPLLDELGGRPMPPSAAYQQILWGFPRGEFVADLGEDGLPTGAYPSDQLIYEVDNVRSWTPYGYSATERALTDGALEVQRKAWLMATYTDGVMPSGWLKAGEGQADWTADQLSEYERLLNDYYSGITSNRQRLRILPYGMEPVETANEAEKYKPDFDLYLLKLNAGHFETTIAELGFTEHGGLGSTGWHKGQAEVQERKATRPTVAYVEALINKLSRRHLHMPLELEIKFAGEETEDDNTEDEIADRQVKGGRTTINEDRDRRGLARFSFPEADKPFVMGGTGGITFLDGAQAAADAAQEQAAALADAKANPPAPGPGGQDGGQPGGHADGPPKPKPGGGQGQPLDKIEDTDLDKAETAELVKGELAAYARWARRNPNPRRPFRVQYATPDDFTDPDPALLAFDSWVFITDAGELLKGDFVSWNAAHPTHPRGPNGKFVKVGSELHQLAMRLAHEHEHGTPGAGHENVQRWHAPEAHPNLSDERLMKPGWRRDSAIKRGEPVPALREPEPQPEEPPSLAPEALDTLRAVSGEAGAPFSPAMAGNLVTTGHVRRPKPGLDNVAANYELTDKGRAALPVAAASEPSKADLARARQARIDRARALTHVAADVEETHFASEGDRDIIARHATQTARSFSEGDENAMALASTIEGHGTADEQLDAARRWAAEHHLTRDSAPGTVEPFDPALHKPLPGMKVKPGENVEVARPGYTFTDPVTGEKIRVSKAAVDEPFTGPHAPEPPKPAPRHGRSPDRAGPRTPEEIQARRDRLEAQRQAEVAATGMDATQREILGDLEGRRADAAFERETAPRMHPDLGRPETSDERSLREAQEAMAGVDARLAGHSARRTAEQERAARDPEFAAELRDRQARGAAALLGVSHELTGGEQGDRETIDLTPLQEHFAHGGHVAADVPALPGNTVEGEVVGEASPTVAPQAEYEAAVAELKAIDDEIQALRDSGNRGGRGPFPQQTDRRVEAARRVMRAQNALQSSNAEGDVVEGELPTRETTIPVGRGGRARLSDAGKERASGTPAPASSPERAGVLNPDFSVNADRVREQLAAATSREEAAQLFDRLNLKAPELRQLARDLGVAHAAKANKQQIREAIVHQMVGGRLTHDAMMRATSARRSGGVYAEPTTEQVRAAVREIESVTPSATVTPAAPTPTAAERRAAQRAEREAARARTAPVAAGDGVGVQQQIASDTARYEELLRQADHLDTQINFADTDAERAHLEAQRGALDTEMQAVDRRIAAARKTLRKADSPDPKAQPPDQRWPAWAVDQQIAQAYTTAILAALAAGLTTTAAISLAGRWLDAARSGVRDARAWIRTQGLNIGERLTRPLSNLYTEAIAAGTRSAAAVLAHTEPVRLAVTLTADWSAWTPGDPEAARLVLSADGKTVLLQDLLDRFGIVIRSIADRRMDELAAILSDGLERGSSPDEIAQAITALTGDRDKAYRIAVTETARAISAASVASYEDAGTPTKAWMNSRDQDVCPACQENEDAGDIPIQDLFPGGVPFPPQHPHCRCAIVPGLEA